MRINKLTIKNFKGFAELSLEFPAPASGNGSFHLVIGQNGKGKTSVLDALGVAAGVWLLGVPGYAAHPMTEDHIRICVFEFGDTARIEQQFPLELQAEGVAVDEMLDWEFGRDGLSDCRFTKELPDLAEKAVRQTKPLQDLPLIAYYGTGRLWYQGPEGHTPHITGQHIFKATVPNEVEGAQIESNFAKLTEEDLAQDFASRLAGYRNCLRPHCNPTDLLKWLKFEQQLAVQEQRESTQFVVVKQAMQMAIEGCTKVCYHLRLGLLITIEGQASLPFSALSDGQRNMAAMIGDIAYKAAQLNPQLGREVLQKTKGIVLIDELDLHLHPRWQRRVIEDLRRIFPEIQFVATTHSPFIVQTARDGEIIKLDGDDFPEPSGKTIEEVARLIMDVTNMARSPRYQDKLNVAREYMDLLAEAKTASPERRAEIQKLLVGKLAPFSDNPAYTALLESKGLLDTEA